MPTIFFTSTATITGSTKSQVLVERNAA